MIHVPENKLNIHLVFRLGSLWVGGHWSHKNRRLCVSLIPFVTIAVTMRGGITPDKGVRVF